MKRIKEVVLRKLAQVIGLLPHALPSGEKEFDAFCTHLFKVYNLPDNRSYRQAIATMIMHLPPTRHKRALSYFARAIKKAQANEAAYHMIQSFKAEIEAEQKAAEVPEVVESTA